MNINNVEIFVERFEGNGNLNFILIHNAGGNHNFFIHQIKMLKNYGNVIQVDLPAHGTSGLISSYKMNDLSSIVAQICKNLSLSNISLIGLNNGADIAIDTVINHSLPVKNLVLIDPPIFMEEDFISEINTFIQQLESPNFDKFVTSLVDALFIHTSADNKEIARAAFNSVDKKSLQDIFRGLIEWNAKSYGILKKISVPALCILTDEHHCSYKKLSQEAPQIEIGKVVGAKCWAALEVPEQVNAMIERFLKIHQ